MNTALLAVSAVYRLPGLGMPRASSPHRNLSAGMEFMDFAKPDGFHVSVYPLFVSHLLPRYIGRLNGRHAALVMSVVSHLKANWHKSLMSTLSAGTIAFALIAHNGEFSTPMNFQWIGIVVLACGVVANTAWTAYKQCGLLFDAMDAVMLGFLVYSGLSLTWSEDVGTGVVFVIKAVALYVIYYGIKRSDTPSWRQAIRYGVVLSVLIALGRWLFDGPAWSGFHNENFATEYLLHALPFVLAAFLLGGRLLRLGYASLVVAIIYYLAAVNPSKIELLVFGGLVGGYCVAKFWSCFPRTGTRTVGLIAVAGVLSALVLAYGDVFWESGFGDSIRARTGMYVALLSMIADAPVVGMGGGGFRGLYPLYHENYLKYFSHTGATNASKLLVTAEAHNDILEFIASFGLVGCLFAAAFFYYAKRSWRQGPEGEVGALVIATAMLNALVEFPLQNPATALLVVLGLSYGTMGAVPDDDRRRIALPGAARLAPLLSAGLWIVLMGLLIYRYWGFEVYDRLARHSFAGDGRMAYFYSEKAHAYDPLDWFGNMRLYETFVNWRDNGYRPAPTPEQEERVYQAVSRSGARYVPLVVYGRLQVLLNDGRYVSQQQEVEALFRSLFRSSSHLADTWILYGYYNVLLGRNMAATQSLQKARALGLTPNQMLNVGSVEALLENAGQ